MTHNSEKSAFASKICVTLAVIKTVKIMYDELRTTVERAWDDRSLLQDDTTKAAIREVVELIDKGLLRTAEPVDLACSQWPVSYTHLDVYKRQDIDSAPRILATTAAE